MRAAPPAGVPPPPGVPLGARPDPQRPPALLGVAPGREGVWLGVPRGHLIRPGPRDPGWGQGAS